MQDGAFSESINDYLARQKEVGDKAVLYEDMPKPSEVRLTPNATKPKGEIAIPEIQSTTTYSMFTLLASNREVDRQHVERIKRKIEKRNLLHINPITVNKQYEVIDGQHRLVAAKELNIPIYFLVAEELTDDDIADLNSSSKNWKLMDYINHFAVKAIPAYVIFSKFCNKHNNINPCTLIAFCDKDGIRSTEKIRAGNLDVSNIELAEKVIGYLADYAKVKPAIAYNTRFMEAILLLASQDNFDHSRMLSKISQQPSELVPCVNRKQFIQVLETLYNYKAREGTHVTFTKR